jgi:predicted transcriptional regulator
MATTVKFSSKIEKKILDELREYAEESKKNISVVLNEAVTEYLARARVRPAFIKASSEVLEEHKELLEKLAR